MFLFIISSVIWTGHLPSGVSDFTCEQIHNTTLMVQNYKITIINYNKNNEKI